jgi:hypothetical protein
MKRLNGKRGLATGRCVGTGLASCGRGLQVARGKGCEEEVVRQALVGKDGDRTVNAANTIVNGYSALTAPQAPTR